jgi:hypothetical protein
MPPRRVFRRKGLREPMSAFIWRFFLAESVQDFDQLAAAQGNDAAMFFCLYYDDHWRDVYQQHHAEIEREWQRRGWSRKQKQFVLTPYLERGVTLKHDADREQEMVWWHEWRGREGWLQESFPQYVARKKEEGKLT